MGPNLRNLSYQKYLLNIVALYKQRKDLRAYLELLLSVIAIAVFVVFAIKPTLVTIGDLIAKTNEEQQTANDLDTKIKNLGIAQANFNANEGQLGNLNQAIPDGPDVTTYVRELQGLAQKENANVVSMSVSPINISNVVASGSAQLLTTTITISGDFNNLSSFIKDVENLRRPAIISKLDLTSIESLLNLTISPKAAYSQ